MRQPAEAAVRPDEQHVSAPRLGQLAVLTACVGAMRDLALRKMPEAVILAAQRHGNPVNVGLNGLKAARRFWGLRTVREDTSGLDKA